MRAARRTVRRVGCGPSPSARTRVAAGLWWRGRSPGRRVVGRLRSAAYGHDRGADRSGTCIFRQDRGGQWRSRWRCSANVPGDRSPRTSWSTRRRTDARLRVDGCASWSADGGEPTKVFFATDVHGSERTWRKFLNAARFYGADVLVMGGDVMGKLTIPIIREAGRRHAPRSMVASSSSRPKPRCSRERRIARLGFYDVVMDEDEYLAIRADPAAVDALFVDSRSSACSAGSSSPRTVFGPWHPLFASGGNDDLLEVMEEMAPPGPLASSPARAGRSISTTAT